MHKPIFVRCTECGESMTHSQIINHNHTNGDTE